MLLKNKLLTLIICLLATFNCQLLTVNSNDPNTHNVIQISKLKQVSIGVNQYIQMGTYYGKPIVWKVINIDSKKGALLLSDKILCLKAFDAAESGIYPGLLFKDIYTPEIDILTNKGREQYGSNLWSNSNIREWLNSDSKKVTYSTQPPTKSAVMEGYNSYEKESGFLTNFTKGEEELINTVKNTTNRPDFDGIGYETTIDKIFLLSFDEYKSYFANNIDSPYLTDKAISNSGIKKSKFSGEILKDDKPWWFWLRTPYEGYSDIAGGQLNYSDSPYSIYEFLACDGAGGIRPALYLNNNISVISGDGTECSPYKL